MVFLGTSILPGGDPMLVVLIGLGQHLPKVFHVSAKLDRVLGYEVPASLFLPDQDVQLAVCFRGKRKHPS